MTDNWLNQTNTLFSRLCGETFTNKEVIATHLGCIALFALVILADLINSL